MIYNVLQYLERSAADDPDKIALSDDTEQLTYSEYIDTAKRIGTAIFRTVDAQTGKPVAVLIDRNIRSICAFMGVVYSGNFYVPIDMTMPEERIRLIYDTLGPIAVIDARKKEVAEGALSYDELVNGDPADEALLGKIRSNAIDTDPLYSIFTSGSTGVPKGVLVCHRSVIDLVEAFEEAFDFGNDTVFGNQAPFDFDVSVKDIYNALYTGGTIQVIPKRLFKTPKVLIGYLQERNINTLIWAVSALRIVSDFSTLEGIDLKLRDVMFSGEVMPVKSLNYWIDHVPDARFVNLYGPTEITCNCTYYIVDKDKRLKDDEMIPAGRSFKNTRVFLKNEKNEIIEKTDEIGEICVEGTCLALGYWNNSERTNASFIQNPRISTYESKIYATGDMGYYNGDGDIIFASRRDHQIKHMGHRIELGEIEVALNAIPFITIACCTYDEKRERIVCHYQADEDCKLEISRELSKKLPKFMKPNDYVRHDELPLNKNGKIDRVALKNMPYQEK